MRGNSVSLVILIALALVLFLPFEGVIKWICSGFLFVLWFVMKLGNFIYVSAYRDFTKNRVTDRTWKKVRRALKWGVIDQFRLTAASLYIQRGDWKEGRRILDEFIARPETKGSEKARRKAKNLLSVARTIRSMTFWLAGDLDGAMKEMEEVYQSGFRDKNLFINYQTYVLEKGDVKKAEELLQASEEFGDSLGIKDNRGWYEMQRNNWAGAKAVYEELLTHNPKFPEPYVHMAQVLIHYGRVREAIDTLEKTSDLRFTQTSAIRKEFIEKLISSLADPATRLSCARSVDKSPRAVALGRMPLFEKDGEPTDAEILSGFASEEETERPLDVERAEEEESDGGDEEERMPDTSLSADDEAYLTSHGLR